VDEETDRVVYNHYNFSKAEPFWYTDWEYEGSSYKIPLRYSPLEVEEIRVDGILEDSFNDYPLYITIDPSVGQIKWLGLAKGELLWSLVGPLNKNVSDACSANVTGCEGFPVIKCEPDISVIELINEGESRIEIKDTCVRLYGDNIELVKTVDRFLYSWYGIMD
jgi:hypothetical protein